MYLDTERGKAARKRAINNYNNSDKGRQQQRQSRISSSRNFLRYKLAFVRCKFRETDLDLEYLIEMYARQSGRCVITNIPMTYQYNDLCSISIDRIESSRGYFKGNIQLICRAINLAKQHLSNSAMVEFIKKVRDNV